MEEIKTISILGQDWTIKVIDEDEDERLSEVDGFCDHTTKTCVIAKRKPSKMDKSNMQNYIDKVIRHEIVHSFLYESGLAHNNEWAQNEEIEKQQKNTHNGDLLNTTSYRRCRTTVSRISISKKTHIFSSLLVQIVY